MSIKEFKQQLNRVFDDNLETRTWENYVDYAIIGLIIISTLQIFLSTFDYMDQHFGTLLKLIDYITIVLFTIEVTLRIWCADLLDEKYKGFWGRVKYCCTFYGLIDFVSTYSFYVALFFPIPYNILKVFRIARLLRIFRYMTAFSILHKAFSSKKKEMVVSLQFLGIVTLILSFILFFVEHEVQPDVYSNGWTSVVWAFAQYIGDPGNFADTPPITITGRIIACIIGILGIAIFAVPAGLIASGFSDAMDEMREDEETKSNIKKIKEYFYSDFFNRNNEPFWPMPFERISKIQSNLHLSFDQIVKATDSDKDLRIVNFAISFPDESKGDPLAVEMLHVNTDYGYCSNPDETVRTEQLPSNILIVVSLGRTYPGSSYDGYHLARIGRFSLVSNEFMKFDAPEEENRHPISCIYENATLAYSKLNHYVNDIFRLSDENSWIFFIGGNTSKDTMVTVHSSGITDVDKIFVPSETNTVTENDRFKAFCDDMKSTLNDEDITVDFKILGRTSAHLMRVLHSNGRKNVAAISLNRDFRFRKKEGIVKIAQLIYKHFETKNKYGLDLIPMKEIPIQRECETEIIRLIRSSQDYSTIYFEPTKGNENKRYTIGIASETPIFLHKSGVEDYEVKPELDIFDETKRDLYIQMNSPIHRLFKTKGIQAFTFNGKIKQNLKAGKYKCVISRYLSEVTLSYEFRNQLKRVENHEFVPNPFEPSLICQNTDEVDFLGIEPFNGTKMLLADEIMYNGMVVSGQTFILDRNAVETQEFYVEVNEDGECKRIEYDLEADTADTSKEDKEKKLVSVQLTEEQIKTLKDAAKLAEALKL